MLLCLGAASCGGGEKYVGGGGTGQTDRGDGVAPSGGVQDSAGTQNGDDATLDGVREGNPDVARAPGNDEPGGAGGTSACDPSVAPPASVPMGWATQGAGTTGGGDATPEIVTGGQAFALAIEGDEPRVIHVNGSFRGRFLVGSNKTIVGVCGAELQGHVRFSGSQNVIFRNLKVVGNDCSESPDDCSAGDDAISVLNGSSHLWFDHLDVSDGSDGNLDITQGADFITVSWTKFWYSHARTDPDAGESGHRFSNLIGASDNNAAVSGGRLNVTFHHDWWADNVDQRMPRSRYGQIHVMNNLFTSAGNSYCTNAGFMATLLVENNVYRGVNRPLAPATGGSMLAVGNLFQGTEGNTDDTGEGFVPPYQYALDSTDGLPDAIMAGVGPR